MLKTLAIFATAVVASKEMERDTEAVERVKIPISE